MTGLVRHAGAGAAFGPPELALVVLGVVLVAICATVWLTWEKAPWWRTFTSPRRQVKDARYRVKVWKLRERHPDAFVGDPMPTERDETPTSAEGDA